MKSIKLTSIILASLMSAGMLASCSSGSVAPVSSVTSVESESAVEEADTEVVEKYDHAIALISEEKYEEAYLELKECGDYEPAVNELENFKFVFGKKDLYLDDIISDTCTYTYDDMGNCTKNTDFGGVSYTEWTYDEHKRPLAEHFQHEDYSVLYNYTYNEDGSYTRTKEATEDSFITTEMYDSENKRIKYLEFYNGELDWEAEYFYDENSLLIKNVTTNGQGEITVCEYEYDEYGNNTRIFYVDGDYLEENVYTLDENGLPVKRERYINKEYVEKYTYVYDEYGNVLEESVFIDGDAKYVESDGEDHINTTIYSDYQLFYIEK